MHTPVTGATVTVTVPPNNADYLGYSNQTSHRSKTYEGECKRLDRCKKNILHMYREEYTEPIKGAVELRHGERRDTGGKKRG